MSLREELLAYKTESRGKLPPEIRETMLKGVADVRRGGAEVRALKEGAQAPDFTLPDVSGASVRLADLLRRGPVVVLFYRGAWCPYCNLQLRAYQRVLPQIGAAGASLVAISPQTPDGALAAQQKHALEFPVLSDVGSLVAKSFGVAYAVPLPVQAVSLNFGNNLAVMNGSDEWILPIPATYLIAPDFRIVMAHVDADYSVRMEPQEILAALAKLSMGEAPVGGVAV